MSTVLSKSVPIGVHLRLGRVSNLPTVWTNVLAGAVLGAGGEALPARVTGLVVLAVSACYVAGMYLNDAFDREVDARERPERPIPAGEISAASVFLIGCALLAAGVGALFACGAASALAGCTLAATILVYDLWHKGNPASPLLMSFCRALVYVVAALAAAAETRSSYDSAALGMAALALMAHIAGLTYAAKQERLDRLGRLWPLAVLALPVLMLVLAGVQREPFWPTLALVGALALAGVAAVRRLVRRAAPGDVPDAVARLIAATCLLDGAVMAAAGAGIPLLLTCVAAYGLTRLMQRSIAAT